MAATLTSIDMPAESDYLLGPVRIEVGGRRLLVAGTGERLNADTQQVDVLICLIRAYPRIVSKDELIEQVWGGRYVTDAALHKTVSMLRKLLRDQHDGKELIETRYRRGYQLSVPAQAVSADMPTLQPEPEPVAVATTQPVPSRRRWWLAAPILLLLLCSGYLWWLRPVPPLTQPQSGTETAPAPGPELAVRNALAQLDNAGLLQTIRDALGSDPELATAAARALRDHAGDDLQLRAMADKYEGIVAYRAGQFDLARAYYEQALGVFETVGDQREQANVVNNLAVLLAESGASPDEAESRYRQALALRVAIDDQAGVLASHRNLSNLLLESGRLQAARLAVADYEAAAQLQGQTEDQIQARILRGDVMLASGEGDALAAFNEARSMALAAGQPIAAASVSQRLGRLALRDGDAAGARIAFEQALQLYRESGETRQLDVVLYNLATAIMAQGRVDEALTAFQAVLDADPDGAASSLRVDTRLNQARLYWALDQNDAATREIDAARAEALVLQSDSVLAGVLLTQASGALRSGAWVAARGFLVDARERLQGADEDELAANWHFLTALVDLSAGEAESARRAIAHLDELAGARGDQRLRQLAGQARVFLASAEGQVPEAYRWFLQSQTTQPALHTRPAVPVPAEETDRPGRWAAIVFGLLGLACGAGIGFALGRWRQSSNPSVNSNSV